MALRARRGRLLRRCVGIGEGGQRKRKAVALRLIIIVAAIIGSYPHLSRALGGGGSEGRKDKAELQRLGAAEAGAAVAEEAAAVEAVRRLHSAFLNGGLVNDVVLDREHFRGRHDISVGLIVVR